MHRFIELNANRRILMVEQEVNPGVVFLAQTDLHRVGHFKQWKEVAQLAQPNDQVVVKMLMALCPDVYGFAEAEGVHGQRRPAGVEILRVGGEDLAFLRFDEVAPKFRGMQVAGGESAFEREMV